jgi:hypothetical protein
LIEEVRVSDFVKMLVFQSHGFVEETEDDGARNTAEEDKQRVGD